MCYQSCHWPLITNQQSIINQQHRVDEVDVEAKKMLINIYHVLRKKILIRSIYC